MSRIHGIKRLAINQGASRFKCPCNSLIRSWKEKDLHSSDCIGEVMRSELLVGSLRRCRHISRIESRLVESEHGIMSRHSCATSSRPRLKTTSLVFACSVLQVVSSAWNVSKSQFKCIPAVWNDENNNFLSNVLPCASHTMFWICSQRAELAKVLTHTATSADFFFF
jgi:hypothetical protein